MLFTFFFLSDNMKGKRDVFLFVPPALLVLILVPLLCDKCFHYSLTEVPDSFLILTALVGAHALLRLFLELTRQCS